MSGHNKWSTIKRQKASNDAKKGQIFTKIANAITIVVKQSHSADIESNPKLRMVLEQARAINLPKENIQRAIDRGLGNLPGQNLEEISFEGFGPAKAAFLIETVTDNKLRTTQEIRGIFEHHGGSLASAGAVSYLFERVGEIVVEKNQNPNKEALSIIDLNVLDIDDEGQQLLVYTEPPLLEEMSNNITQLGFTVLSSNIIFKPNVLSFVSDPTSQKRLEDLVLKLEDQSDTQSVYANFKFGNS